MSVGNGPTLPKFPRSLIHPLGPFFRHLPLALRRHLLYLRYYGRWGNFRNPVLASEKMQWRIINDRRSLIKWTTDKLAQKQYVREVSADANLGVRVPATYWSGVDADDLLTLAHGFPGGWVMKPNHSSSRYRLYRDGLINADQEEIRRLVPLWSKRDEEELVYGNWAYRHARHMVIAEERIGSGEAPPIDVKLYCYGGRAQVIFITYDLHTPNWRAAYYTPDLTRTQVGFFSEIPLDTPTDFEALPAALRARVVPIAEAIAAPFDSVRVDLYISDGAIWFGELTPYSSSGLIKVDPKVDRERGSLWTLPELRSREDADARWERLLHSPTTDPYEPRATTKRDTPQG